MRSIFSTKEGYYKYKVSRANMEKSITGIGPGVSYEDATRDAHDLSAIVSGHDDRDRAAAIVHFLNIQRKGNEPILLFHNGNEYLKAELLNKYGYEVKQISLDPLEGLLKYEKLAVLCPDEYSENDAFFWLFAMDVCEALGMESNLMNLSSIDWTGISWQRDLLTKSDKDMATDLIRRYNESMAKDASKCMVRLERIVRGFGINHGTRDGISLNSTFRGKGIYEMVLPGAYGELTKRVFEKLCDEYERRSRFVLILDNVYLPNQSVIKDGGSQVKLLLSGNDVGRFENDPSDITQKTVYVCLLRHDNCAGIERLSKYYFGNYRRMIGERSYGRESRHVFRESSVNVTYREQETCRLSSEAILALQPGFGYIKIPDGYEGKVCLSR